MKISYNWLKSYVDIKKSPEKLADDLSLFGHEVESIAKANGDYIFDLEITPNRGDCLSILGMAREVAALYKLKVKIPTYTKATLGKKNLNKDVKIQISNPNICPRFTARIIDNIKIGPSPKWMQERLISVGFRPVNNIVDITNYVMFETGQPLHAFDYNKNRVLNENAIITGIMGGLNSEVDAKTKTIILQGAIFDPVLIRKTSKSLNHITEASYRYERGVDFEGTTYAVDLATRLILKTSPSAVAGELIDKILKKYEPAKIAFSVSRINKLLGTNLSAKEMQSFLERLNFKKTVPSYRAYDVKTWQDIAEEVARIYGYNNLEKNDLKKSASFLVDKKYLVKELLKDLLANKGFDEVYSYSFAKRGEIEIQKSLSPETQYLCTDLLHPLLVQIAKNPWAPEIKIFEIGDCFTKDKEFTQLAIAETGKNKKSLENLIVYLKEKLGLKELRLELFEVEQKILDKYKIRKKIIFARIDLEDIVPKLDKLPLEYKIIDKKVKYKPISRFAPTVRDLAFIADTKVDSNNIADDIKKVDNNILIVELFDEFVSEKFGKNKKNIAFHIWFQKSDVEKTIKDIIELISKKYSAKLRVV